MTSQNKNIYSNICGDDIHCLAAALVLTIVIILIIIILGLFLFYYRKSIFPCLKEGSIQWAQSRVNLQDLGEILLNREDTRVSARFVGKNSEIHLSSNNPNTLHI